MQGPPSDIKGYDAYKSYLEDQIFLPSLNSKLL
jgi:hypothetical protein